jgi:histidinol dehydrogenase
MKIKTLNTSQANFDKKLRDHLSFEQGNYESVEKTVNKILKKIRESGDSGLRLLVEKYDKTFYKKISDAIVTKEEISDAYSLTPNKIISSLRKAMRNIKTFSKQQKLESWSIKVKGSKLGEKVTPINSVGIYVPGGKASYPSTVLMNAIPAQVAGVKNITMVCPPVAGKLNPLVLIAADLCGVNKIYKFGGAHAIGALAFGTETIKSVDKIVGPGNIYVATAKKKVYGSVGIDSFAGPSEVLIIADQNASPELVAIDMFAQAEHDELAQAILLTSSKRLINSVSQKIKSLISNQSRKDIIEKSLSTRGLFIKVKNIKEIISIANQIAPEHLEIFGYEDIKLETKIDNAGAIFIGQNSPEVFGDYCAGPNHVLPTSGSARYASPLGVYDFLKRTSLMKISALHSSELSSIAALLADCEGLTSHSQSAKLRK